MSKSKKVGIILIIVGAFIPSVLYPFATLTTDATLMKVVLATKGGLYKPRLNDLEIVLRKSDEPLSEIGVEEKRELKYLGPIEENPYLKIDQYKVPQKKVAVPYNYIVALGITITFVGISFVALSRKKKDIK